MILYNLHLDLFKLNLFNFKNPKHKYMGHYLSLLFILSLLLMVMFNK